MLRCLIDFALPSLCVVCGRGATAFCRACRDGVPPVDSAPLGPVDVRVGGAYDGALRSAVLAFKHGRRDVGVALADFLAERWSPPSGVVLVPLPTALSRRAERGFDQAELLARELARATGAPVVSPLRRRGADTQNGRTRSGRLEARGRFALVSPAATALLAGVRAVLVDDVVTTGSTVRDAAATLSRAGVTVCGGVAIARTFPAMRPEPGGAGQAGDAPPPSGGARVSWRGTRCR